MTPLFGAIMPTVRDHDVAGATVFEDFMGYAPHEDIATSTILRLAGETPIIVDTVDKEERRSPVSHGPTIYRTTVNRSATRSTAKRYVR